MDLVACTQKHTIPNGRVELLGAWKTVTGAMTRVESGGAALLVDCGIAQGDEAHGWQLPDGALDVDAVLLTHGHNDHVGSLPELLEHGFNNPILGTAPTLEIARITLLDGLRLQRTPDTVVAAFERDFRRLARPVAYNTAQSIAGWSGSVTFREAGHILGSASVDLVTSDSRVICSGDLWRPGSPILADYTTVWPGGRPVDLVVMESTYGDRDHAHDHHDIEKTLERVITKAMLDGGHILVPAFAIGRTQTLLFHLNNLVESGRVKKLPVAVDSPMGMLVTELYGQNTALFDAESLARMAKGDNVMDFKNLYAVSKAGDSMRLREQKTPWLIIAGSGMCTGGRILGHLRELLPRPETCVMFVGYQAKGSTGRRIQEAVGRNVTVRIDAEDVPVRASVETIHGLSAHADRGELLRWLKAIPQVRRAALHHGEVAAQEGFVRGMRE